MYFDTARLLEILIIRFFSKIQKTRKFVSKGSPFNFDILQQTGFSKSPEGPPFTGLKSLRFLNLRYTADFRRPRLCSDKKCHTLTVISYIYSTTDLTLNSPLFPDLTHKF